MAIPVFKTVLCGASGKMGRAILHALTEKKYAPFFQLSAITVREDSHYKNKKISEICALPSASSIPEDLVALSSFPNHPLDICIDFSSIEAFSSNLEKTHERRGMFVSGTTGLSPHLYKTMHKFAQDIPILYDSNFSISIAFLRHCLRQAAHVFSPEDFDVEIFEAHHNQKQDAPSGTALALGAAVAEGRNDLNTLHLTENRKGKRPHGAIGYAVSRGRGEVGFHSVKFMGEKDQVTFTHEARSRSLFAEGALNAILSLLTDNKQLPSAGFYSVDDCLKRILNAQS